MVDKSFCLSKICCQYMMLVHGHPCLMLTFPDNTKKWTSYFFLNNRPSAARFIRNLWGSLFFTISHFRKQKKQEKDLFIFGFPTYLAIILSKIWLMQLHVRSCRNYELLWQLWLFVLRIMKKVELVRDPKKDINNCIEDAIYIGKVMKNLCLIDSLQMSRQVHKIR